MDLVVCIKISYANFGEAALSNSGGMVWDKLSSTDGSFRLALSEC
jgi:hypothetical protein